MYYFLFQLSGEHYTVRKIQVTGADKRQTDGLLQFQSEMRSGRTCQNGSDRATWMQMHHSKALRTIATVLLRLGTKRGRGMWQWQWYSLSSAEASVKGLVANKNSWNGNVLGTTHKKTQALSRLCCNDNCWHRGWEMGKQHNVTMYEKYKHWLSFRKTRTPP